MAQIKQFKIYYAFIKKVKVGGWSTYCYQYCVSYIQQLELTTNRQDESHI